MSVQFYAVYEALLLRQGLLVYTFELLKLSHLIPLGRCDCYSYFTSEENDQKVKILEQVIPAVMGKNLDLS